MEDHFKTQTDKFKLIKLMSGTENLNSINNNDINA